MQRRGKGQAKVKKKNEPLISIPSHETGHTGPDQNDRTEESTLPHVRKQRAIAALQYSFSTLVPVLLETTAFEEEKKKRNLPASTFNNRHPLKYNAVFSLKPIPVSLSS